VRHAQQACAHSNMQHITQWSEQYKEAQKGVHSLTPAALSAAEQTAQRRTACALLNHLSLLNLGQRFIRKYIRVLKRAYQVPSLHPRSHWSALRSPGHNASKKRLTLKVCLLQFLLARVLWTGKYTSRSRHAGTKHIKCNENAVFYIPMPCQNREFPSSIVAEVCI
jgi:hypothetical protein